MSMSLFHPRVIKKHINKMPPMDVSHSGILSAWAENLRKGIYDSETQNDGEFIQQILINVLGYVGSSEGKNWSVAKNQPINHLNVDVALGEFSADNVKIIAPFELKGAKTKDLDAIMAGRGKTPVQQAWEYANEIHGGSCQWVIVSNYREIRLYAFGYGKKHYESFDLSQLNDPQNYKRFMLLLSAENLLSGKTLGFLKESEQVDKDITNQLYADYKALRANLIKTLGRDNADKDPLDIIKYTQTILDRVLFVAFAEDKGLLPENTLKNAYETQNNFNPQPIWNNFKGLFHAIDKGNSTLKIPHYNGGLFAENSELDSLSISDALCEGFKKIGDYDFDSDVSVNILGHIFEQSISDLEELKAHADNIDAIDPKQSKRKKDGIFYTPAYITRYIVEQAVGGWLSDRRAELGFDKLPELKDEDYASITMVERGKRKGQITYNKKIEKHIEFWEAYKEALSNIKVLDPACGSGAFLNEVFDYLKTAGEAVNSELAILKGEQTALFRWDTHILANNIYGVDLNNESVEITKLSLWLKTANRQEKLTYLENNIKCGNSLIDDADVAGDSAFNWNEEFSEIMKDGGFDVIVGNPPYAGIELIDWNLRDWYKKNYKFATGRFDLYSLFIEKCSYLANKKSYTSLIIPNKYLRNTHFALSRKNLLENYSVNVTVIDEKVFEGANVESIIILLKRSKNKKYSCIFLEQKKSEAWSIKSQDILDSDNITYPTEFSKKDGICSKIESSKIIISDIADVKDGIISGKIKDLVFMPSPIDSDSKPLLFGKDIDRYYTGKANVYVNYKPSEMLVEELSRQKGKASGLRLRDKKIFERNKILTRFVASKIIATFDTENNYYSHTIHSTYIKDKNFEPLYVLSILNSKLYEYYYKRKNTKSGKLFPQVRIAFLNNIPIKKINNSKQKEFISMSEKMFEVGKLFFTNVSNFTKLFISEFNLEKVSRKLENWYELEFSDFVKEIEKSIKPQKLSLSQKAEWMTHFETEKAKALALKNQIDQTDKEIDQMVYALYDLTPEEIALIEKSE